MFFNETMVLWTCQNQNWDDFFFVRHEMFLDDVDGGMGWILWLINKLQILLCTIWTDKGLFDCRVWAPQGRGGATGNTTKWSFPLVTVQGDSGFDWKFSNRLIVQPQAHYPLLGESYLNLASGGACLTLTSSLWPLGVGASSWRIHLSKTDWSVGNVCVPLDVERSGVGLTWFVVLLQLYPSWFCWGASCLPCL